MLVVQRKKNEAVRIHGNLLVRVVKIEGNMVRLAFEAPRECPIHREELLQIPEVAALHGVPVAVSTRSA